MNWYKQHKESMALPEIKNEYPPTRGRQYGLEYLDQHLSEEKARELSEPQMQYLDSGYRGSAFLTSNNIVKKFTRDMFEADNAKEIIKRQNGDQPLPGLVYVYGIRDLSADIYDYVKSKDLPFGDEKNKLFEIKIEKVQPLSDGQKRIFTKYDDILNLVKTHPKIGNEVIIQYIMGKMNIDARDRAMMNEETSDFLNMAINFIKIILSNKYKDEDIYCENVGIRNGNEMVILDLGSISFPS